MTCHRITSPPIEAGFSTFGAGDAMRPEDDTVRIRRGLHTLHARREQARQMVCDGIALEMECDAAITELVEMLSVAQHRLSPA